MEKEQDRKEVVEVRPKRKQRKNTPLHIAILNGKIPEAIRLIQSGTCDLNAKNLDRISPFQLAAQKVLIELIEPLATAGANPNSFDYTGRSALIECLCPCPNTKHFDFFKALIDHYARNNAISTDPATKDPTKLNISRGNHLGETPIHFSISVNGHRFLSLLLENGADPNYHASYFPSPLAFAHERNATECIALLAARKAIRFPAVYTNYSTSLPKIVSEGWHKDDRMKEHERDFGGTLFADHIEPFFLGKKPRKYMAVELYIALNPNKTRGRNKIPFSWIRGIITKIISPTEFEASCIENQDHRGKIPGLGGRWKATLIWDNRKESCWQLKSLKRLTDQEERDLDWDKLLKEAKEEEKIIGRRTEAKKSKCMVLKGFEDQHGHGHGHGDEEEEEVDTISEVHIDIDPNNPMMGMRMKYVFADREPEIIPEQKTIYMLSMFRQMFSEDRAKIKEGDVVTFVLNGVPMSLAETFNFLRL